MATVKLLPDKVSEKFERRNFTYPIFLHDDLLDIEKYPKQIQRKFTLELANLAARGAASSKKSCKDVTNRGWFRTPVSGNNHYLWWTHQGGKHLAGLELPRNAIVLRAVRHHDNHEPLRVGDKGKLTEWKHPDQSAAVQPWTEEQAKYLADESQIRILQGNPGSGKTTALWQAVSARDDQTVVYLTWSQKLAQTAEQHFKSFAGKRVNLQVRDFRSFWSAILKRDLPRIDAHESRRRFLKELTNFPASELGVWKGAREELYAEVRAEVYGRGNPMDTATPLGRLDAAAYSNRRKVELGKEADSVVRIVEALERNLKASDWIPDLEAACEAARFIRANPQLLFNRLGVQKIDRIVIDEVQDLTRLEFQALMFFYEAVANEQEQLPFLLIAGDEGQTVVPTHFKWGPFKDSVYFSLESLVEAPTEVVTEHKLRESLRCPRDICRLLDSISGLYGMLPKGMKPGDQTPPADGHVSPGKVLHAVIRDSCEAGALIEKLAVQDGFAVLRMDDAGIQGDLAEKTLTPAEAKGLEYQSVCLVNPGRSISRIKTLAKEADRLDRRAARTAIDELRVALSRTTSDLIFLDVCPSDEELRESTRYLENPVEVDALGIEDYFGDIDDSPEQRVQARIGLARSLEETDLRRAWRLSLESWRMLGNSGMTNGVSDSELRLEVMLFVLQLASRLIVREIDDPDLIQAAKKSAREIVKSTEMPPEGDLIERLILWQDSGNSPLRAVEFLEGLSSHSAENTDWLKPVLKIKEQTLRKNVIDAANEAKSAPCFKGAVERWLQLLGEGEDSENTAKGLRESAFNTLLKGLHLDTAKQILEFFPGDLAKDAMWHEASGKFEDAARLFEKAAMKIDALRSWRAACNWEMALRLAEGEDAPKLEWLDSLTKQILARPKGIDAWLTPRERRRLDEILEKGAEG